MTSTSPANLFAQFRLYLDIALFRRGPEELPVSPALLFVTFVASVVITLLPSWISASSGSRPAGDVAGLVLIESAFQLAWYWGLLTLAGRPERFLQTSSALFGVKIVIALVLFVFTLLVVAVLTPLAALALPLMAGVQVWQLALNVRILQSATQWPMVKVVVAVLAQLLLVALLLMALFPDAVKLLVPDSAAT